MSPRRSALVVAGLLFAVALLAAASNVAGRDITYDFVDYPLSQIDSTTGRKDHVSGQVTTDGTLGVYAWNSPDVISLSFTLTTALGATYPVPDAISWDNMQDFPLFTATSSELLVPEGEGLQMSNPPAMNYTIIEINWDRQPGLTSSYSAFEYPVVNGSGSGEDMFFSYPASTSQAGNIGCNDPWVIATAQAGPRTHFPHALGPGTGGTWDSLSARA